MSTRYRPAVIATLRYVMVLALHAAVLAAPVYATHETVFAANAADTANNRLLGNPPLPMLRYAKSQWKLGLAPYYFTAEQDFTDPSPSGEFIQRGNFSGWGLGGSASWAFAERWGLYLLGVGSRVTGRDLSYNGAPSNPTAGNLLVLDAGASAITLSGGIVRQFFGGAESAFVLPVFAGPMLKRFSYSHRVIESFPNGTIHSDYDVAGEGFDPGLLVGTQAGIELGKAWRLNPFFIFGMFFSEEIPVDVTNVRTNTQPNNKQSNLNRLLSGEDVEGGNFFGGFGLNLAYRPWGVSANLTSPFLPSFNDDNLKTTMVSISWAFGPGR